MHIFCIPQNSSLFYHDKIPIIYNLMTYFGVETGSLLSWTLTLTLQVFPDSHLSLGDSESLRFSICSDPPSTRRTVDLELMLDYNMN